MDDHAQRKVIKSACGRSFSMPGLTRQGMKGEMAGKMLCRCKGKKQLTTARAARMIEQ
jgi:hypothetical protein